MKSNIYDTRFILTLAVSMLLLFVSQLALAKADSSQIESTCRIKAKEVATETYRGCVTENKSKEIERIKQTFQEKLDRLKKDYEGELAGIGAKKKGSASSKKISKLSEEHVSEGVLDVNQTEMDIPEPKPLEGNGY